MSFFFKQPFKLDSIYPPAGDQPQAIQKLVNGIKQDKKSQVLLGVTGSGKTYTMANVIAQVNLPTLILSHNKTLAAQLFQEFRRFFPENAVEYFVSYYDYYQPEAYVASTDTYIEKDSSINEEIDKLRHSATRSLLERSDVIIVSSISCIYGLGSPEVYEDQIIYLEIGKKFVRKDFLAKLIEIQYKRQDNDFVRGSFRVRGDCIDVYPAAEEEHFLRIEFFDEEIESIISMDALTGQKIVHLDRMTIFPASHYVTTQDNRKKAMTSIQQELKEHLIYLRNQGKILEAKRLEDRTRLDLEMIKELGFCSGIENYSRHLTGRSIGQAPPTLLEYFPKEWLLFVDESHVTVPQIGGMFRGDRARKMSLVEHGFRLPSALDNRPLNFEEWENLLKYTIYVSATPGDYEVNLTSGKVVEQVIRPTGLLDPLVEIRPAQTQVDDLLKEIRIVIQQNQRVLVTTLTKAFSEKLTNFYQQQSIRVKYLHSDIDTLERVEIINDLRAGQFDVLIGINLLREGLDIPEVRLVAILDADKEGFLRSHRSLVQTIGRAARNVDGYVVLYADTITQSMQQAISETQRRRSLQEAFNQQHGITPVGIQKAVHSVLLEERNRLLQEKIDKNISVNKKAQVVKNVLNTGRGSGHGKSLWQQQAAKMQQHLRAELQSLSIEEKVRYLTQEDYCEADTLQKSIADSIEKLTIRMKNYSAQMQFEQAVQVRERISELKKLLLF